MFWGAGLNLQGRLSSDPKQGKRLEEPTVDA